MAVSRNEHRERKGKGIVSTRQTASKKKRKDNLLMMHRNKIQTAILAIYMRHNLTHHPLQLGRISKCRASHLDHNDVPDPFRIILK